MFRTILAALTALVVTGAVTFGFAATIQQTSGLWHIEATFDGSDGPYEYRPNGDLVEYASEDTCKAALDGPVLQMVVEDFRMYLLLTRGQQAATSLKVGCVKAD